MWRSTSWRLMGVAWLAGSLVLTASVPAYGYVDPGSGTMLWQLVLAGTAGALLLARRALGRVVGLLRARVRRER
ncbi:MAG: hypothetical protein QN144_14590 [Armatimonadota bacterium]|nr:hypothetical protein [Armatimonadota bacterium]